MSYPRFGDYQAVVTDNSEFYKRGYIRVRVSAFYSGDINWDLSQNYNDAEFKTALKDDIRCMIATPVGGGSGHGMFSLPQVNSVGIVSFLDGNVKKAIWKGSFINPQYDADGNFLNANVPNDKIESEGPGTDGLTSNGKNVDSEGGAFIFRQKSTESGNADNMNWDKNRTENLMVFSKKDLKFVHVSKWEENVDGSINPNEYQEIAISEDDDDTSESKGLVTINIRTISTNTDNTTNEFGVEIYDGKVSLVASSDLKKTRNRVTMDTEEIVVNSKSSNSKYETSATFSPKEITLKNKETNLVITRDEINISGDKKVTLSGNEVLLGGLAEEYVVTASSRSWSYRMEDGTVLSASRVAKA
jgi:hypothetical protein